MPEQFANQPRGTEFKNRPYQRGDRVFLPIEPLGINLDHPAQELGPEVWTGASAMLFRNDAAERAGGEQDLVAPPFAPQYLVSNQIGPIQYWLVPGGAGVGVWDGQATFDITPVGMAAADAPAWTGGTLSNVAFLNQADQVPWYWDGQTANVMEPLPGWIAGSTAYAMRAYKSFLVALNITEAGLNGGTTVRWSAAADPGQIPATWVPAPDNDAGDAVLATTPGNIIDAWPLRNTLAIYKDHATHVMQFVSGQFVMIFRKVLVTSGVLTRNCIVEVLARHIVMTDGDVVAFDGQNAHSLIQNRLKRWVFQQIDAANYEACFVVAYQSQSEVWVCFPETGHTIANLAAVWNYESDSWSVRPLVPALSYIGRGIIPDQDVSINWDGDAQAWDEDPTTWSQQAFNPTHDALLGADLTNTQLQQLDIGETHADGSTIVASIDKRSMRLGKGADQKLVVAVWPQIEAAAACIVTIRVGTQQSYADPILWQTPVTFDATAGDKVDVLAVGRLISVSLSSDCRTRWRLTGFAVEFTDAGAW